MLVQSSLKTGEVSRANAPEDGPSDDTRLLGASERGAAVIALKNEPPETVTAVPVGSQAVSNNSTVDEQRSSLRR